MLCMRLKKTKLIGAREGRQGVVTLEVIQANLEHIRANLKMKALYFRDQTNPYHTNPMRKNGKILAKTFFVKKGEIVSVDPFRDQSGRFFPPPNCFALL